MSARWCDETRSTSYPDGLLILYIVFNRFQMTGSLLCDILSDNGSKAKEIEIRYELWRQERVHLVSSTLPCSESWRRCHP